jgi:ankyrin repeat protein
MAEPEKEFIKAAKVGNLARLSELLEGDEKLIDARDTDGSTALHCAAWKGHLEIVAFLIDSGADVHCHNSNDHWGTTPLHAAAHANQAAIAQRLIEAGADVNAKDSNGKTPLHHTIFHKAIAAAKVLVKHGIPVSQPPAKCRVCGQRSKCRQSQA